MPRRIRVEFPGAICHALNRADRWGDIFYDDVDRQDLPKALAGACQKHGIGADTPAGRREFKHRMEARRKSDPEKLRIAARLRRETTLTIGWIAQRLWLGTRKSASTRLQEYKAGGRAGTS